MYKKLKYRVPKKNAKYPGELCCEACHYKCKALNERCVFFDTGEASTSVKAEKKAWVNYTQLKYHVRKVTRNTPNTLGRHAATRVT